MGNVRDWLISKGPWALAILFSTTWLHPGCSASSPAPSSRQGRAALQGMERELDAPLSSPAPGAGPAVASSDGSQYLVVWNDMRALRPVLYGARVDAGGNVLDPEGLLLMDVLTDRNTSYRPSVAFDGVNYLVVVEVKGEVRGLRVSPQGTVLDPGGFPISAPGIATSGTRVFFDGTDYMVFWLRADPNGAPEDGIYRARVTPAGTVLDPGGVAVMLLSWPGSMGVAFDGTNYLLSFTVYDQNGIPQVLGTRMSKQGVVLDAQPFAISAPGGNGGFYSDGIATSFDGTNFTVVWFTYDDENIRESLYVTRVTPQGAVRDPAGIFITTDSAEFTGYRRISAMGDGAGTTIAWSRSGSDDGGSFWLGIQLAHLDQTGTISRQDLPATERGIDVALAPSGAGGGGGLLVWRAGSHDPSHLYPPVAGTRLAVQGVPVDVPSVTISRHANAQEVRAMATDGQSFFVVWTDARASEGRGLYGALASATGEVLAPGALEITPQEVDVVDVVFDGLSYVVIFTRQYEDSDNVLQAVRVSPQGAILDTAPIDLPLCSQGWNALPPRAVSSGTHTLLVANGCTYESMALAAVLLDHEVVAASDVATLVPVADRYVVEYAEASFDGTGYLVVWQVPTEARGQRLDLQGNPAGSPFTIASISSGYMRHVSVQFGAGNHLLLWQDSAGLHGTRVDPQGQVLDAQGFDIAVPVSAAGSSPTAAFDGTSFLLAWHQETIPGDFASLDLMGAELTPAGALVGTFPISQAAEAEGAARLRATTGGAVLAAYTRFVAESPYSARRARARSIQGLVEPGPDAGGEPDAGMEPDAGARLGGGDSGCCSGAPTRPSPGLMALVLAVFVALRRRRRAAHLDP